MEVAMIDRRNVERGFTLIELLVVVGIIAVLMGIVIAVGAKVKNSGKVKSTKDLLLALDAVNAAAMSANSGQVLPAIVADPRLYTNRSDKAALAWIPVADARADFSQDGAATPMINSVGLFLWQARQYPEAAKLLEGLPSKQMKVLELDDAEPAVPADPTQLKGQPPLATAIDAWGNPIRYVHPSFDGPIQGGPAGQPDAYMTTTTLVPLAAPGVYEFLEIRRNSIKRGDPATDPSLAADSDGGSCVAGRPYFYSAGPDGDPSTTEDNVYSTAPTLPKKK
jgi:prepilin-type N-terminal cleavage/methylation domain-containing protein